jgi:hypothetical protein
MRRTLLKEAGGIFKVGRQVNKEELRRVGWTGFSLPGFNLPFEYLFPGLAFPQVVETNRKKVPKHLLPAISLPQNVAGGDGFVGIIFLGRDAEEEIVSGEGDHSQHQDESDSPPDDGYRGERMVSNGGRGQADNDGGESGGEEQFQPPRHQIEWSLTTDLAPALETGDQSEQKFNSVSDADRTGFHR